jgi:Cellulose binding domain
MCWAQDRIGLHRARPARSGRLFPGLSSWSPSAGLSPARRRWTSPTGQGVTRFQRWYPVAALVLLASAYGMSSGGSSGVAVDEPAGVTVTASVIMGGDSAQTPDSLPGVAGSGAPTPGAGAWGVTTSTGPGRVPGTSRGTSRGTPRASLRPTVPPPVPSSTPTTQTPTAAARCSYATSLQTWVGGFSVTITVTNLTSAPWSNWSGSFTTSPAVQVVNSWGAVYQTYGNVLSAVPASYNAVVSPGASASFGLQGSMPGPVISFSDLSVNGVACRSA